MTQGHVSEQCRAAGRSSVALPMADFELGNGMTTHEDWMRRAVSEAEAAAQDGEAPLGRSLLPSTNSVVDRS